MPREPREEPKSPREEPRIPREVPGERPREEPRTPDEEPRRPREVPPDVPPPTRPELPRPSRREVTPANPPSTPPPSGPAPSPGSPPGIQPPQTPPPSTDPTPSPAAPNAPQPSTGAPPDVQRVDVKTQDVGKPLEKVLSRRLVGATWPSIGRLLRQKRVEVDGRPGKRGQLLKAGEKVTIRPGPERAPAPPQPNRRMGLVVVHEDPHLAVVLKPAGRPVHPGPGHGTDTMLNGFVARWPELVGLGLERGHGLVHRLDLETSGLLAVARTAPAYDGLVAAFAGREVEKEYLAIVRGRSLPGGVVDTPVDGKPARTRFETLETLVGDGGRAVSLVRAWPETGRTHQIRIHLASLGHPVLSDRRYGDGVRPEDEPIGVPRLALHAHRLAFVHPVTKEKLAFEAPLPRDLRRAWKKAGGKVGVGADEHDEPVP